MTKFRGYNIEEADGVFVFSDTGLPVEDTWQERPCGACGRANTPEGHDGCLGTLPGVVNACCGHGVTSEAYVMFVDDTILRGAAACVYFTQELY